MMQIKELFERPDKYLLAFEDAQGVFVDMDREAYNRSIFCDMRISPKSKQALKIAIAPLCEFHEKNVQAMPRVSFIFHVAHCGSTLLARALDLKERSIVYREPLTLRQLAVERASAGFKTPQDWDRRTRLAVQLLDRRYFDGGPAIVKANVPVNFIISDLLDITPSQPSIVLYFPLEHYLLAVLRSPNHKKWVASVVTEMQHEIKKRAPLDKKLSIAQAAAALWWAQIKTFHEVMLTHPTVASLNAEDLFDTPERALGGAFNHMQVEHTDEEICGIVRGDLFSKYSKNPSVDFNNASRLARRAALKDSLVREIEEARSWIANATAADPLPARLGRSLVGEGPELLMQI